MTERLAAAEFRARRPHMKVLRRSKGSEVAVRT